MNLLMSTDHVQHPLKNVLEPLLQTNRSVAVHPDHEASDRRESSEELE
jgi:hypothetical protein